MESKVLEILSKYKRFRVEASDQKKSAADPVKAIYTRNCFSIYFVYMGK
jgi:hypothetical protein